ncbi:MAG: hypothetical protein KIH69_016930 [Anaerolineae bacterium]|nr:hypothetical protein [Anaerolineae bacterium]
MIIIMAVCLFEMKRIKLVLVIIFVCLFMVIANTEYEPPVIKRDAVLLINATQPENKVEGFVKKLWSRLEIKGGYTYELLGWRENLLIYKMQESGQLIQYDVITNTTTFITNLPELDPVTVVNTSEYLHIRKFSFWPTTKIANVRDISGMDVERSVLKHLVLRGNGLQNKSAYIAVIVQPIYGPQDIIILK